jgi:hypothetical protein
MALLDLRKKRQFVSFLALAAIVLPAAGTGQNQRTGSARLGQHSGVRYQFYRTARDDRRRMFSRLKIGLEQQGAKVARRGRKRARANGRPCVIGMTSYRQK